MLVQVSQAGLAMYVVQAVQAVWGSKSKNQGEKKVVQKSAEDTVESAQYDTIMVGDTGSKAEAELEKVFSRR